jgi:uncharacterized HhH-GPD family protein
MAAASALEYTNIPEANRLLAGEPLALLIGMLLYQQVPVEKAFTGPYVLRERLGGTLDAATIATMDPEELAAVFKEKPALHRFPGNMAKRVQGMCGDLVERYDGDAAALWTGARDASDLVERLSALSGFGEYKARILVGVLGTRLGVRPRGWKDHLPDWPSIVDVGTYDDVAVLKERKKAWKEAGKDS